MKQEFYNLFVNGQISIQGSEEIYTNKELEEYAETAEDKNTQNLESKAYLPKFIQEKLGLSEEDVNLFFEKLNIDILKPASLLHPDIKDQDGHPLELEYAEIENVISVQDNQIAVKTNIQNRIYNTNFGHHAPIVLPNQINFKSTLNLEASDSKFNSESKIQQESRSQYTVSKRTPQKVFVFNSYSCSDKNKTRSKSELIGEIKRNNIILGKMTFKQFKIQYGTEITDVDTLADQYLKDFFPKETKETKEDKNLQQIYTLQNILASIETSFAPLSQKTQAEVKFVSNSSRMRQKFSFDSGGKLKVEQFLAYNATTKLQKEGKADDFIIEASATLPSESKTPHLEATLYDYRSSINKDDIIHEELSKSGAWYDKGITEKLNSRLEAKNLQDHDEIIKKLDTLSDQGGNAAILLLKDDKDKTYLERAAEKGDLELLDSLLIFYSKLSDKKPLTNLFEAILPKINIQKILYSVEKNLDEKKFFRLAKKFNSIIDENSSNKNTDKSKFAWQESIDSYISTMSEESKEEFSKKSEIIINFLFEKDKFKFQKNLKYLNYFRYKCMPKIKSTEDKEDKKEDDKKEKIEEKLESKDQYISKFIQIENEALGLLNEDIETVSQRWTGVNFKKEKGKNLGKYLKKISCINKILEENFKIDEINPIEDFEKNFNFIYGFFEEFKSRNCITQAYGVSSFLQTYKNSYLIKNSKQKLSDDINKKICNMKAYSDQVSKFSNLNLDDEKLKTNYSSPYNLILSRLSGELNKSFEEISYTLQSESKEEKTDKIKKVENLELKIGRKLKLIEQLSIKLKTQLKINAVYEPVKKYAETINLDFKIHTSENKRYEELKNLFESKDNITYKAEKIAIFIKNGTFGSDYDRRTIFGYTFGYSKSDCNPSSLRTAIMRELGFKSYSASQLEKMSLTRLKHKILYSLSLKTLLKEFKTLEPNQFANKAALLAKKYSEIITSCRRYKGCFSASDDSNNTTQNQKNIEWLLKQAFRDRLNSKSSRSSKTISVDKSDIKESESESKTEIKSEPKSNANQIFLKELLISTLERCYKEHPRENLILDQIRKAINPIYNLENTEKLIQLLTKPTAQLLKLQSKQTSSCLSSFGLFSTSTRSKYDPMLNCFKNKVNETLQQFGFDKPLSEQALNSFLNPEIRTQISILHPTSVRNFC